MACRVLLQAMQVVNTNNQMLKSERTHDDLKVPEKQKSVCLLVVLILTATRVDSPACELRQVCSKLVLFIKNCYCVSCIIATLMFSLLGCYLSLMYNAA